MDQRLVSQLGALVVVGCAMTLGCGPPTRVVRVFAPRCPGQADLAPALASQLRLLDQSLSAVGLPYQALHQPSWPELRTAIARADAGWFLLSYTGHGQLPDALASRICLAGKHQARSAAARAASASDASSAPPNAESISINQTLLPALSSGLSGATLLVDACQSAQVDPRRAKIPTSVISSSPYTVDTDSLFGDRLALAIRYAAQDPNCDGLITDQELFEALTTILSKEISLADQRAFPKLRRNASSHLPLPIAPSPERLSQCAALREDVRTFARRPPLAGSRLAQAIEAQLALDPLSREKADLPRSDCDYFVAEPARDADGRALRALAATANLCEFSGTLAEAEKIARFAIFAEFYSISLACRSREVAADAQDPNRWVRIIRLRDEQLVAVRRLSELARFMPRGKTLSPRRLLLAADTSDAQERCQIRYSKLAPREAGVVVHCNEPEGQCFETSCSEVLK